MIHWRFNSKFNWIREFHSQKERLFVFGSGWSLNEISDDQWSKIRNSGDTMGFNDIIRLQKTPINYYIIREGGENLICKLLPQKLRVRFSSIFNFSSLRDFNNKIKNNSYMNDTKYIYNVDIKSGFPILHYFLYKIKYQFIGFYSNMFDRTINWPISRSARNIPHGSATLFDAINLGYLMGYKEVVLVGVDLYDSSYFYQDKDKTRDYDIGLGRSAKDKHKTSKPVLEIISKWKNFLQAEGVSLYVYNQKSLLKSVIPIFYDK